LHLVVPISLATISAPRVSGQLYYTLRTYKADNITASVRDTLGLTVAAVIGRFLHDHTSCIEVAAGGTWEAVTIVPSTRNRAEPHPLAAAIGRLPKTGMRYANLLQATATWEGQQREASDQRFTVTSDVRGVSILIIDDTFTTGSRIQSAASALSLAGARVIAAVPIARIVNAEYAPDVLAHSRDAPYDFRRCCLD
jgi:phosphoribosylpyrophosphate synthetase